MTNPQGGFVGGAIDLAQVKARAEARAKAEEARAKAEREGGVDQANAAATGGAAPFFTATEENFEADVVRRSAQVPVVVLVGTARSDASEQLKSDFESLALESGKKFVVAYVDADVTPQLAQVFGVRALPTVIALGAGQPLTNFEGAQPRAALEQWVTALVEQVAPQLSGLAENPDSASGTAGQGGTDDAPDTPADPRLDAAMELLNKGDFDGAIAMYEGILNEEPNNSEIKQALDTTKLLQRLNPAARDCDPVADADAAPGDVDKQMVAADAEIVAGAPEKAFARLIACMREVPGEKDRIRERLLELFGMFDAADPRVLDARRALASALY